MTDEELDEIVETLRECAEDSRKVEGDYYADQFATDASVFEEAAAAIERLRSQPCPYVTGTVTRYCTLTPFTLTDAERETVAVAAMEADAHQHQARAATLRGLLERLSNPPAADRP